MPAKRPWLDVLRYPANAMERSPDLTTLLNQVADGDQEALGRLIPLVYDELRRLAAHYLRDERPGHTLQTTALVHEAYFKPVKQRKADWRSKAHFLGVAAQLMRRILLDHAKGHLRDKRGGREQRVSLDEALVFSKETSTQFVALNESLVRLAKHDPRQARIVELRYFSGLTVGEVAEVLSLAPRTVEREWTIAKAWLYGELKEHHAGSGRKMGRGQGAV
jgi:RNA polymerase sigma factor (TIGR02999 family)